MEDLPLQTILEYKGSLTFNTISYLLPKLKEVLDKMGEKINTYKRLLTITIETLENSFRYIDSQPLLKIIQEKEPPFIKILKKEGQFHVEVGNTVLSSDKDVIISKIDQVNSLDETGLRDLYKRTIANGQFSAVGGAGLGFIEMAKASGSAIKYNFVNLGSDIYYYTIILDVKI